ncbi:MAG TPA: PAS domain S-box protein, partial [Nitrospiraceae bacterium]|nr:PAS domain S-box protein [Nitrospiraceae bacterium]
LVSAGKAGGGKAESVVPETDGYLYEPFAPGELVASVHVLLRDREREAEKLRLLEQPARETAARTKIEQQMRETEERCRAVSEGMGSGREESRKRADRDTEERLRESRERLQYALDSADMVAWDWLPESDALTQSPNACRVLGLPPGTSIKTSKEYFAMIHLEDQPRVVAAIQRALREGTDYHEEFRLVLADGSIRWVADRGRVTERETGKAARMTGVIRDITQLKMRETAVRESEERFRAIFHQAAVGMCLLSPEGGLLQVNQKLCALLGEEPENLLRRTLLEITHAEDRARNQQLMSRLLLGGVADVSIEQRLLRRDGGFVWVSMYLALLWDAGGRLQYVIGVVQDIDERKRAAEALRESDRRFREMIDALPAAIYTTDVEGRVTHFNPAAAELSGRTPSLGTDRWCVSWKLYRSDGTLMPHDECPMAVALKENRIVRGEEVIAERPDGRRFWFMPYPTPLRDAEGRVVGGINMLVDITARKEAERQLHALNADLEQRVGHRTRELVHSQNRLRRLATDLSVAEERERRRVAGELHDYLAQLLVATRMKLNQARHGRSTAKQSEVLAEVDQMLDQSLTYTRTLVAQLSPPVLHEFGLGAALKWLGEQMTREGLSVRSVIDDTPVDLPEDAAVLLFQSARELLLNVVKHAETDRASLQLECRDGELQLTVMDQGRGFDTLSLRDTAGARNAFGLFSIRERMECLGGRVELVTRPGQGTTVRLIMPLSDDKRSAEFKVLSSELTEAAGGSAEAGVLAAELKEAGESSMLSTRHSELQSQTKFRVLLVDDHAMVRQGLRSLLENHRDVEVVAEAGDGRQAIVLAEALCPDVVVMDLSLPLLDGVEATRRICLTQPTTVVIGLSVHQSRQMEQAVKSAGAAAFLTKDCAVDQLYEAMTSAMMARSS